MSKMWFTITGWLKKFWNWLTSMKTALLLLFLLALGSIPGALLPQKPLNESRAQEWIANNGTWAEILDSLDFFDVFNSPWFQAIYLLLFVSLIGCIAPRIWELYKALKKPLPKAPKNLARMPQYVQWHSRASIEDLRDDVREEFKTWRHQETQPEQDRAGAWSYSAEKGFMREVANLCFHIGLVLMLITIALGKIFSYEGQVIVIADTQNNEFCNTAVANYDSFRGGIGVDGTTLNPFCLEVESFDAEYNDKGQPRLFKSEVKYASSDELDTDPSTWEKYTLQVNHPLSVNGNLVYLQGHGYAPTFTVTWPNGESRTETIQFRPDDMMTFLSSGVVKMDPPAGMYTEYFDRRNNQIAIQGLFAPTARFTGETGQLLQSAFPALNNPAVAVDIYVGDTGLDSGRSQSIFDLDPNQISSGALMKKDRVNLKPGESATLDDGTVVTFDGAKNFVNLQVSHTPADIWILLSSLFMLVSLVFSLTIKRRRMWVRLIPCSGVLPEESDTVLVQIAGLAKTDQAGWDSEFLRKAEQLLGLEQESLEDEHREQTRTAYKQDGYEPHEQKPGGYTQSKDSE